MRTVTFSDEAVVQSVKETLVATWLNRVPQFHNCEFKTEEAILDMAPDAFPTKNFCTYFCTPDKKVLHYFTGYYSPKAFLSELEFVAALLEKAVDATGAVDKDVFRKMHEGRVAARKESGPFAERKDEVDRSTQARRKRWSRDTGGSHLNQVNRAMAESGPRDLEDVLKSHLYGNDFSEEKSKPDSK